MTAVTVSTYQQAVWAQALAAAIDNVVPLSSGTVVGSTVATFVRRSGVLVVNASDLMITASGMTHLGFSMGGTLVYTVPWTGGYAAQGQLAYTTGPA